jgi:HlyD family secretion protein
MTMNQKQPNAKRKKVTAMHFVRRALVIGVVGVVAVGLVLAWMPQPVPVDLGRVERGPLAVTVDEDGQARVKDRYVVSAPLTGSLARVELDAGSTVKAGDVLARLVPVAPPLLDARTRSTSEAQLAAALAAERQVSAQIERAVAAKSFAEGEARRFRALHQKGTIPETELERALLSERTASAELDSLRFGARVASHEAQMARAALSRLGPGKGDKATEQLEVPSPVTGKVLKVFHKNEGVVQAGTQLVEIGDPAALEIAVDVLTTDAVRIKPGATVTIDRWGGKALDARVRHVEPSAFTRIGALGVEEQRVNVLIDIVVPHAEWAELGDGYRVEAHVVVYEAAAVVQVPSSAVFRRGANWAAYRVEAGKARETRVEIGQSTGQRVEIKKGLAPGAEVVLHPSDRVIDGVEVAPR